MSSPAVTVGAGASLTAAAKIMDDERVKRLPVVDGRGRLVGLVARADLLRGYLRDDDAIARGGPGGGLPPDHVDRSVDGDGVGRPGGRDAGRARGPSQHRRIAARLTEGSSGVVEVANQLGYGYDDSEELKPDIGGRTRSRARRNRQRAAGTNGPAA